MKRLIAILLVLDIVIFSGYFYSKNVYAADMILQAKAGDFNASGQVPVIVSLRNNPGVAGIQFKLNFDNTILTPVSLTQGNTFTPLTSNLDDANNNFSELTSIGVIWVSASDIKEDGDVCTVTFQLKPTAPSKGTANFTLSYEPAEISNQNFQNVSLVKEDATAAWEGWGNGGTSESEYVPPSVTSWTPTYPALPAAQNANATDTPENSTQEPPPPSLVGEELTGTGTGLTGVDTAASVPMESISLSMDSMLVAKGDSTPLLISFHPSNTTDSKLVVWETSDSGKASVSEDGWVTGVEIGEAVITARVGEMTAVCSVQVTEPLAGGSTSPEIRENPKTFDTGDLLPYLGYFAVIGVFAFVFYWKVAAPPKPVKKRVRTRENHK
ncbi:MAG: Ig-like domain-containing protein [Clostridiales bacterium]|jgi:hypothetical protein|nr:Ig-like domain-containing protein [Clostridiales bacterium]